MKTKQILRSELKDKIKTGDLIYGFEKYEEHKGWRLVLNNDSIGLNTKIKRSHSSNNNRDIKDFNKCIFTNEIKNNGYLLAEFLHTYDESIIQDYIYEVVDKIKTKEELRIEEIINEINKLKDELAGLTKLDTVDVLNFDTFNTTDFEPTKKTYYHFGS